MRTLFSPLISLTKDMETKISYWQSLYFERPLPENGRVVAGDRQGLPKSRANMDEGRCSHVLRRGRAAKGLGTRLEQLIISKRWFREKVPLS
ncbi:unnamed protein product [Penicillium roqueforti FM164]|uniref:Genomic scaffold, ProqFM164S02 n=1 Tax=Penicillium roqueforti (strain FM164) TaxID=1365484 RepID=W6QFJ0_PENRF|nr:unnamed protein product [Penicillium roqueforti FM164]